MPTVTPPIRFRLMGSQWDLHISLLHLPESLNLYASSGGKAFSAAVTTASNIEPLSSHHIFFANFCFSLSPCSIYSGRWVLIGWSMYLGGTALSSLIYHLLCILHECFSILHRLLNHKVISNCRTNTKRVLTEIPLFIWSCLTKLLDPQLVDMFIINVFLKALKI